MQALAQKFSEEMQIAWNSLPKSLLMDVKLDPFSWIMPNITSPQALSTCIDHTLLKPDTVKDEIDRLCDEAKKYLFFSVCVNTGWVLHAKSLLQNSEVKVATTVGFPLGAMRPKAKWEETRIALEEGADEIDMVISIGALKSQDFYGVYEDIYRIKEASRNKTVKVILESGLLNTKELFQAAILSKAAKADFLKTSTGFVPRGATVEVVQRLRYVAGDSMGVKASGGIRTTEQALQMIAAGANRLGCSSSVAIVQQGQSAGSY